MTRAPGSVSVGAAILLALVLFGCEVLPGRPKTGDLEVLASQVTSFDALYGRYCAGCHGADGRLGAARPLNDPLYLALIPRDRLRKVIADGVPGTAQPAFGPRAGGVLTDDQINALIHGLIARWVRPEAGRDLKLPPYATEIGNPGRGKAVYAAACAGCHGAEGRGGPRAGPLVDASYLALVSDQSLRTAVIAGRADLGMPDWRGYIPGRALTPREISDVVAWLVAHRRPVPGRPVAGVGAGG